MTGTYTRTETHFISENTQCAATTFLPDTQLDPQLDTQLDTQPRGVPVIVMAHGFGGVRALRLPAYAEQFATAGYAVLTFDYRGFGDSEGRPRQLLDIADQHADWRAAIDFARALPGVDGDRVIAWGTSFAGGHVITLAGQGVRLAAIIAQVPHVSGPAAVRAAGLTGLRLIPQAVRDQARGLLGKTPLYVPGIARSGELAMMSSNDAWDGYSKLLTESGVTHDDYPTTVAARIALKIGLYSPARSAGNVTCPALVQVADHDAIAPASTARKAAERMPQATIRTYDGGHFDPYVEPLFGAVIADQLAFLTHHVPTTTDPE